MIAPRWRKVLRDIWVNRARTILIVLTIAAGVFAVGTIGAAAFTMNYQYPAQYQAIRPAHLIFTTSLFETDLAHSIESMPGVADAEARCRLDVRLLVDEASDTWRDLQIYDIVDFDDQRVDKILPVSGDWPPSDHTLLMDRGSLEYLGLKEGQSITIKTPLGKKRTLVISGVAHDLYHMPAILEGMVYGFITDDTLQWLGQGVAYNQLHVRVEGDLFDPLYMRQMKEEITDRLEDTGVTIFTTEQPDPEGYPMDYVAQTVVLLQILLGGLTLLLGVCLVIITMSGLVAQQARQIAVIKAVGGRTWQVMEIYLGMVLFLGVLSALIAIPLSTISARYLVTFVGGLINYEGTFNQMPAEIVVLQVSLAVFLPMAAALLPVWSSARRSPALALSEYGGGRVWASIHRVDRIFAPFQSITRLERLALRNPFRNRNRLIFSLIMLSLAGASFIALMNLEASLTQTVERMLDFWQYDFGVSLNKPYLIARLQNEAARVPGIVASEGWGFELTRRVRSDGSEGNPIYFFAAPPESELVRPNMLQGRWLIDSDENAMVIGAGLLDVEPDLGVGRQIILKVNGEEHSFYIVGVVEMIGNQTVGYLAYTHLDTFNRIAHQKNRSNMIVIRTTGDTVDQRRTLASAVEKSYKDMGIQVTSIFQMDDERMEINSAFDIVLALLFMLVLLLSLVGGLGLMGTMSLNVLERSREIGVIRALGGSNRSVFRLVLMEGITIGVMSWMFSLIIAIPLTWLFCDLIGRSFMSIALAFRYSASGAFLWLGLVIVLSVLSSMLPALNAVRLTVREIISYE